MSGSLDRLVLGAQGRLPVAEPLRPSRYAPSVQGEPFEATVREPAAEIAEHLVDPVAAEIRSIPPETAQPGAARAAAAAPVSPVTPRHPAIPAPAPPSAPLASANARGLTAGLPEPTRRADTREPQVTHSAAAAGARELTEWAPEPPRRAEAPQPQAAAPVDAALRGPAPLSSLRPPSLSQQAAVTPRFAAPQTSAPLAPTRTADVHISIGRVEVHAAAPSRPAPTRAPPARSPPLSLADYRAQRK